MKRSTISLMMAMLTVCSVSARQISPAEAMALATDFMNNSELQAVTHGSKSLRPMRAPGVEANAAESPYYVFNRGESDGFVIISGDDRAPKILGYSDKGSFDAENMPPQLKAMMEQWATQMTKLPTSAPRHASWNKTVSTRAGEGVIMETAEWGQGYPYNGKCPVIDGEQAPAGCTATAMAIVMKYHNWPETTQGVTYTNYCHRDQTVDYSSQLIDWNALNAHKDTESFKKAVADLNYLLGVAIDTHYASFESVADVWPVAHRMTEHFKYSPDCQFIERKMFSDEKWHYMIKEQLDCGYPVIYNGNGGDNSVGHAFVLDGYSSDGLYHVNWGWDGSCNGYYPIDGLIPDDRDFSQYSGMTMNIIPDKSGKIYSRAFIPNAEVYLDDLIKYNDFNFSVTELKPGESFKCTSPFMSYPYTNFSGTFGIAIVDKDNNIVKKLFEDDFEQGNNSHRLCGCSTDEYCKNPGSRGDWWNLEVPGLSEGQRYQIVCYDSKEEEPDWRIVTGGIIHPSYFGDSNLNSEKCLVYVHKEEGVPITSFFDVSESKLGVQGEYKEIEPGVFEVLKGCGFGFWAQAAGGDVDFEFQLIDEDGNEIEPIFVYSHDYGMYSTTLTVLEPINRITLKYKKFENTRHDQRKDPSKICVQDGLVYEILDETSQLIGYDNASQESLDIPDYVLFNDKEIPVTSVSDNALSGYKGLKHATLGNNIEYIDAYAFSLMPDFESLTVKNKVNFNSESFACSIDQLIIYLASKNADNSHIILNKSVNEGVYEALETFIYKTEVTERYADGKSHVFIPGIGKNDVFTYNQQMWDYAINRTLNGIKIQPLIEEISIQSVFINGQPVVCDEDYIYHVDDCEDIEVCVNYILHGFQEMTTVYTAAYNKELPNQRLVMKMGDSNGDGIINIADAVNAANYIVGLSTTDFDFEYADVNKDGDITVSDVTSIISLIPAQTYVKQVDYNRPLAKAVPLGYLVSSTTDNHSSVEFSVVSDEDLTALQFDVRIPSGFTMPEFKLSDEFATSHKLQKFNLDANTVRVIVYSASGKLLTNGGNHPVVTLNGATSNEDIIVSNIFASDACGASRGLEFEDLGVSNAVSGSSITSPEVKVDGNKLVVSNAAGNAVSVYALDGRCIGAYAVDTDRFEVNIPTGIYIVTVDKSSHRVIIK